MSYIKSIDNKLDIPAGLLGTEYKSINQSGRTLNLDTASTDIWDGAKTSSNRIWVPPTIAQIHNISSTSSNDTSSGKGMQTVRVFGLDANWDEITEDITLNGTTSVPTVNSYIRIHSMYGLTWGSLSENAGDISATASIDSTVTAQINHDEGIGNNKTQMAIYTVPNGYTAFMTQYYVSMNRRSPSNASFDLRLLIRPNADIANSGYLTQTLLGVFINNNAPAPRMFNPYYKIEQKTDIVMRGTKSTDNNVDATAGFDLILINNNAL